MRKISLKLAAVAAASSLALTAFAATANAAWPDGACSGPICNAWVEIIYYFGWY